MKWVAPVLLTASLLSALTPGADADCSQGICAGIDRAAIICQNTPTSKPCGDDQPDDFVLTCGQKHDSLLQGTDPAFCKSEQEAYLKYHGAKCGCPGYSAAGNRECARACAC